MTGWSDDRPRSRKDRVAARGESLDSLHGVPADLDDWSRFYSRRASEEVCPKHRNNRLETAGWHREMTKRCLFLVAAAKRGGVKGRSPTTTPALLLPGGGVRASSLVHPILDPVTDHHNTTPMNPGRTHERKYPSQPVAVSAAVPTRVSHPVEVETGARIPGSRHRARRVARTGRVGCESHGGGHAVGASRFTVNAGPFAR